MINLFAFVIRREIALFSSSVCFNAINVDDNIVNVVAI